MALSEADFIRQLYGIGDGSATTKSAGTSGDAVTGADDNPILKNKKNIYGGIATTLYGLEAITALQSPDIDYDILNETAEYKELKAKEVEIKAVQEANKIREQFAEAVGTYQARTARRGVVVGQGSAAQNVERSSADLGKDIQTTQENADWQASRYRISAKNDRRQAEAAKEINKWRRWSNFANAIGKGASTISAITQ